MSPAISKRTFIDLFAGAGGLSEGFIRAGFEPVGHVEMDRAACYTLTTRAAYHHLKSTGEYEVYKDYLKGKITREKLYTYLPSEILDTIINLPIGKENNQEIFRRIDKQVTGIEVDVIVGGPPCQAYSLMGRSRSSNGMKDDPRNFLYIQYAKYLERYQPNFFVFENVIGLKSANNGIYLDNMKALFERKGYSIKLNTVEANNFGVLQKRRRIIIIGWKHELDVSIPNLEKIKISSDHHVSVLLNDLPKVKAGGGISKYQKYLTGSNEYLTNSSIRNGINILTQHVARPQSRQDLEIYKIAAERWKNKGERLNYNDLPERLKSHNNRESFFDRFKVVADNINYSHTVVAHISKDGHYFIHPDVEQNRSITIREAARLQSFPDDFYFEGVKENMNRTAAFKQIGNAVPPLLAYEIAKRLKKIL